MLKEALDNREKCLVINGENFDAIAFAADRENARYLLQTLRTMGFSPPWIEAVKKWEAGDCEFIVLYATTLDYMQSRPHAICTDSLRDFEIAVHQACSLSTECASYWDICLGEETEAHLKLVLHSHEFMSGTS